MPEGVEIWIGFSEADAPPVLTEPIGDVEPWSFWR